ncbi:MAG: hypothetical protein IPL46_09940 [Saprospiraceae bacterium]|nr:hypothetical protein [Saprospiraceae bacterium]
MRSIRAIGLVLFILGAGVAIVDLLDMIEVAKRDNPFYGALALMIAGISLTFLSQTGDKNE